MAILLPLPGSTRSDSLRNANNSAFSFSKTQQAKSVRDWKYFFCKGWVAGRLSLVFSSLLQLPSRECCKLRLTTCSTVKDKWSKPLAHCHKLFIYCPGWAGSLPVTLDFLHRRYQNLGILSLFATVTSHWFNWRIGLTPSFQVHTPDPAFLSVYVKPYSL